MTSLLNNQDTLNSNMVKQASHINSHLNKQRAHQELISGGSIKAPFIGQDLINVSNGARKMLETVLKNCDLHAVPATKDEYYHLQKILMENEDLSQTNVARMIRSLSEQLKYDLKLQQLVVKELGFDQQTRIFHTQEVEAVQHPDEPDNDIGYIKLSTFLEKFAQIFDITQQFGQKSLKNVMGSQESHKTQNNETFISPVCSQQQINEARQLELIQITSVFDDQQSRYQQSKQEIFDTTQNRWENQKQSKNDMDDCYDLLAHENLEVIQNQNISATNYHHPLQFLSNQSKNRYPQHSGLMDMINNIHGQKQQTHQANPSKNCSITPNTQFNNNNNLGIMGSQTRYHSSQYSTQLQQQQQHQITHQPVQQPDFNKNLLDYQPLQQYKLFANNSLLSANNSVMNTPINHKDLQNNLYPNHSTFKPKSSAKLLFGQNNPNQSPKYLPHSFSNIQTREFSNAKTLFHSENKQLQQSPMIQKQILGQKQRAQYNVESLERQVNQQQHEDVFTTPVNKRIKSEKVYSSNFKNTSSAIDDLAGESSSESEIEKNDGEINDNVSSASRKKRGLKILSVKVQELVYKKQQTTYKDVANELIKQLRDNKNKIPNLEGIDNEDSLEGLEDDDYLSDESPNKRGDQASSSSQQKWEKNVRRRVYDALNVLYAAGVLKKEGKHVSCDNKVLQLTNKLKDPSLSNNKQIAAKCQQQDLKMMQHIEQLKFQVQQIENRVEQKREVLFDQYKHFISYKNLIHRNKQDKDKGCYDPNKSVSLPFILVSTKDCPDNEVEISFGEQNKSLNIAMKKPMKCIGDADTLIKLEMYKVSQKWVEQVIPDSIPILKSLNEKQRYEILA
ncbi:transcription factor-like protein dpb-like [Stylonychia lemnae]|uniref:Transcription factor-like protein dpb-like n=1 Tax=Stylonychia lemnae TaxID=5949 RepID=A0A078A6X6_STYLE|nr:transcription factor-like protein dpb-like [Stylonychia lemnae]|eukprot:CDW76479.1 transcription factor-like protein dpb-like [Stylonychia lemnae]